MSIAFSWKWRPSSRRRSLKKLVLKSRLRPSRDLEPSLFASWTVCWLCWKILDRSGDDSNNISWSFEILDFWDLQNVRTYSLATSLPNTPTGSWADPRRDKFEECQLWTGSTSQ